MHERETGLTPIEEIDRAENQLRGLTAQYLQGQISPEEYNQSCQEINIPLDVRRLAAELDKQNRRRKIDQLKEKVSNIFRRMVKRPA